MEEVTGVDSRLFQAWRALAGRTDVQSAVERLRPALTEALGPALSVQALSPGLRASLTGLAGAEAPAPGTVPRDAPAWQAVAGYGEPIPVAEGAAAVALARWCRAGGVAVGREGVLAPFAGAARRLAADARVLAVPLVADGLPLGVLLVLRPGGEPGEGVLAFLSRVAEPFGLALAHAARHAELTEHRAAAEADRQALLDRLGRTGLDDPIVGAAGGLRGVMERVDLVARAGVPVLLLGETGSGKEVVARAIHHRSPRGSGPFLRVNCGAIPPELIDSQLFGHERGSFTGATARREGWFERSDGGTLFLDEVGELPLAAQVRLLRVLQDGLLERVGGSEAVQVDCRIVAATHRDLPKLAREGAFREDLWYRLSVFPIVLPSLRERPEDIPALVRHFAQRAARRFGLLECAPGPADLERLQRYPWPGNVRELAAVIDRAAILGLGRRLDVEAALGAPPQPARADIEVPPAAAGDGDAVFPTLDAAVRAHVERALEHSGGRIEGSRGAAALLGVNPHTLRARMRKLGIDWQRFRRARDSA